jgi:hypothetical protein
VARARTGAAGAWRWILDSLLRRKPAIRYTGADPLGFDLLVLVAPIWGAQLAGPMRSFVAGHRHALPPLAVVSVKEQVGAYNAVAEIARRIGTAPMFSTAVLARSVEDGSWAGALQAFCDAVRVSHATSQAVRASMWSPEVA